MTISKGYSDVFDALEDSSAIAQNLKIRADLMKTLREFIDDAGLGQKEAAEVFGVHQPRCTRILRKPLISGHGIVGQTIFFSSGNNLLFGRMVK
jgi:predicted XRE-type DNA-binding protein